MYSLTQSMALFWTLSEGLILVCLRWGLLVLRGKDGGQGPFILLSTFVFFLLCLLMFTGETLLDRIVGLENPAHVVAGRWGLWTFFCTLWVALEGVIMIYVIRIYRIIKVSHSIEAFNDPNAGAGRGSRCFTSLLVCFFLVLYLAYQAGLLSTIADPGLDSRGIYRVSLFYVRVCGIFWIAFEWVVAILGIRTFLILKETGEPGA